MAFGRGGKNSCTITKLCSFESKVSAYSLLDPLILQHDLIRPSLQQIALHDLTQLHHLTKLTIREYLMRFISCINYQLYF